MVGKTRETGGNQSVARALAILELLAESAEPLGVREMARRLRVAASNVQRLITTLARSGFLEQDEATKRYTIGYRAFQVGNAFVVQSSLYSAVMPELYDLANQHVTGFLGVRRDMSVVYLATVQSEGPVALTHRPGSQAHLHSTAMGKALLAELSDDAVRALLGDRPLPRLTAHTRSSLQQLLGDLAEVRRVGYATSEEENRQGFFSAGAVVRDASGAAIAVVSGAVPSASLKAQERAAIGRLVLGAAQRASRKLGAPGPRPAGASERFAAGTARLRARTRRAKG
jgi:DNA-binding IclR family transcriptional regulator